MWDGLGKGKHTLTYGVEKYMIDHKEVNAHVHQTIHHSLCVKGNALVLGIRVVLMVCRHCTGAKLDCIWFLASDPYSVH